MDLDVKTLKGRSVCIACGRKKERVLMVKHGQHWTCNTCLVAPPVTCVDGMKPAQLKALNLYAGLGGNRKLWPANVHVTAVELNPKVAAAYQRLYPLDTVVLGDAHQYLLKNFHRFDFIWASSPCPSHSRMNYWLPVGKKQYPDLSLYEEIILLKNFCKGKFALENVNPYYEPLIPPDAQAGRHLFWSNFKITPVHVPLIQDFINLNKVSDKDKFVEWLGIDAGENIYLKAKNPMQVYRNCVHPLIGQSIFNDAFGLH